MFSQVRATPCLQKLNQCFTHRHMNHRCPHSQIQTLYPNIKKEQNVLKNLLKKQKFQENPCHVLDTNMPIHFILDYNRLLLNFSGYSHLKSLTRSLPAKLFHTLCSDGFCSLISLPVHSRKACSASFS